MLVDGEHIFVGERLEVEAVAGVVIRRDSFRVAVDHDGFVAIFTQRKRGMATAIIEFNSLPDTVRTTAQDDYLLVLGGRRLVFLFIRRVEIWRVALKLGSAGIHQLVNGLEAMFLAQVANVLGSALAAVYFPGCGETGIRQSHALGFAQEIGGNGFRRMLLDLLLHINDLFELVEEPGIDAGNAREFFYGVALAQGIAEIDQALGMRGDQALSKTAWLDLLRSRLLAGVERSDALHHCLFESASHGHGFADGFHLWTEALVSPGKFLELPFGDLDDDIVDGRLEASRSLAHNVVGNLVE